jgi:hypothetical protein
VLGSIFHRWFNPHCVDCNKCPQCDRMMMLMESDRRHYETIIESLTRKPEVPVAAENVVHTPIGRARTWHSKRAELELAERARVINENKAHEEHLKVTSIPTADKTIDELEEMLSVNE